MASLGPQVCMLLLPLCPYTSGADVFGEAEENVTNALSFLCNQTACEGEVYQAIQCSRSSSCMGYVGAPFGRAGCLLCECNPEPLNSSQPVLPELFPMYVAQWGAFYKGMICYYKLPLVY